MRRHLVEGMLYQQICQLTDTHSLTESIEEEIAGEERRFRVDEVLLRRTILSVGHRRLEKNNGKKVSVIVLIMQDLETIDRHGSAIFDCLQPRCFALEEPIRMCPTGTASTCMQNLLSEGHVVAPVVIPHACLGC